MAPKINSLSYEETFSKMFNRIGKIDNTKVKPVAGPCKPVKTYNEALAEILGHTNKDAFNLTHTVEGKVSVPENAKLKLAEDFFSASLQFIKKLGK